MTAPDPVNLSALIDDAKCFALVRQHRWPDGVRCPACDSRAVIRDGHDVDLVDLDLARQPHRRGLGGQAAPQRLRHGLRIRPVEAQLLGDRRVERFRPMK